MSYRVDLPVFSGPLDLLLHLIKQQEVDIHEVRIASILDQYFEHLNVLQSLDLADIGDFVVMASSLMEIKSRELIPTEAISLEEELDPKDDLIRRLLEYKRYRDVSRRFDRLSQRRAKMLEVIVSLPDELRSPDEDEDRLDLDNVEIWALTGAFAKLLEEVGGAGDPVLHVGIERRNVRYYTDRVLEKVRGAGEVEFSELFERGEGRYGLVGVFVACLELMKQGFLRARQEEPSGPITLMYRGPEDLTADEVAARQEAEEADGAVRGEATEEATEEATGEVENVAGPEAAADHNGGVAAPESTP